ncbi:hypothetical protein CVT25_001522 [Psilocybe cyanescens]|uniref:Uncharacterized protein n=1 Tax=Psilocybe cyanescens TaxID=93625 RepID=A0A409X5K9_PSICY|nr:hypothetical protein CVT25_001522 [Psilocybe cyanescens]
MSLSAEAQDARMFSTLPAEIVDDIIDEACRTLNVSSVSSVALTSHIFRIHANKARFSSLIPHRNWGDDIPHTAKSIRGLTDIIRSGKAITTMPGVCSFATSFSLQMIGFADEVMPVLNDGNLSCIFGNLFRENLHTNPASSICSLSLSLYRWSSHDEDNYNDPGYHAMDWLSMSPELLQEFQVLLRESDITRLCLEGVFRLPGDFLRGTKINHLYLRRASIYPFWENHDTAPDPKPVSLESLDIDDSVSPAELDQIALPHLHIKIPLQSAHGPSFPFLTMLHMVVVHISMFDRLDRLLNYTPHLQSLALTLHINRYHYTRHEGIRLINYSHLKHLNRITFVNEMNSPVSLIVDLTGHNISASITELEIQLPFRSYYLLEDVIRHLKDHNINILDSHLVHPAFDSIRRIVIGVELEMTESGSSCKTHRLLEECRSYVESQLPLLWEKKPDTELAESSHHLIPSPHQRDTGAWVSRVAMSLSAEAQDARMLSTLPAEIVDDIIEEACRTLNVSSVSSVALTSHIFRIHANKARFSSLIPHRNAGHDIPHTAKSIRGLADIIRSGQAITTMPGVCSFAASFTLRMIGYTDEITPTLNDGSLACIFRNLFRPPLHTASSIYSLSLYVHRWSRHDDGGYDDPRYSAMNWLSMITEIPQEFKTLLRESDITRLSLEMVRDIPRDFLRGTKIKHLCLRRVSIYPFWENHDTAPDPKPVSLASLDIDDSVSPTELGQIALPHLHIKIPLQSAHGHSFPFLTMLHMVVVHISMFDRLDILLNYTPHLQSLALTLHINRYHYTRHEGIRLINYNHLRHLNRLTFVNEMNSPVSLIVDLVRHDISTSITELEIQLPFRCYYLLEDVIRHLKDHNINILDSHLVHPAFDSIRRIVIGVELEMTESGSSCKTPRFLEECRSYVESQLPLLLEKKSDAEQGIVLAINPPGANHTFDAFKANTQGPTGVATVARTAATNTLGSHDPATASGSIFPAASVQDGAMGSVTNADVPTTTPTDRQ